jgi:hypothetical protein
MHWRLRIVLVVIGAVVHVGFGACSGARRCRTVHAQIQNMVRSKRAKTSSLSCTEHSLPDVVELRGPPVLPPGCSKCEDAAADSPGEKGCVKMLWSDSHGPAVFALQPALFDAECRAWIEWGEARGFSLEKLQQNHMNAHRDNFRIAIESEEVAAALFERLRPIVPALFEGRGVSGLSSNIRLYKYEAGQRFGKHIDQSNFLGGGKGATEFTVLVYLNEGVGGGETVFYKDHDGDHEAVRFSPSKGSALLHAHGRRCLTHEGAAVTAGVKYVLRSDVCYSDE